MRREIDFRALLKISESEPARRLSGHKAGKKPRERSVFLFSFSSRKGKLPFFCLENPQAFSNCRFSEAPFTDSDGRHSVSSKCWNR